MYAAETIQSRKLFKSGNYMRKYGVEKLLKSNSHRTVLLHVERSIFLFPFIYLCSSFLINIIRIYSGPLPSTICWWYKFFLNFGPLGLSFSFCTITSVRVSILEFLQVKWPTSIKFPPSWIWLTNHRAGIRIWLSDWSARIHGGIFQLIGHRRYFGIFWSLEYLIFLILVFCNGWEIQFIGMQWWIL